MYTVRYPAGVAGNAPAPPADGDEVPVASGFATDPRYIVLAAAVVIALPSTMQSEWFMV